MSWHGIGVGATCVAALFALPASATTLVRSADHGGTRVVRPIHGDQNSVAVAFDGKNYFVVWADYRSGPVAYIYGARVTPGGVVLDPGGIRISKASIGAWPALAFNGKNYFVVWDDQRAGGGGTHLDLYGARVTPAGRVLDPHGILIARAPWAQFEPAVASDGSSYYVVWQDSRDQGQRWNQVYGTRVTSSGVVVNPGGVPISLQAQVSGIPNLSIAFGGTNYVAVWGDGRTGDVDDVYGARISRAGAVLDPGGIPIATTQGVDESGPAVAFGGSTYLVAWSQGIPPGYPGIHGARIDPGGQLLAPGTFPISTPQFDEKIPSMSFDGHNYLLVWERYLRDAGTSDIYALRVSPLGAVLDSYAFPVATARGRQSWPRVASGKTNSLAVWVDTRLGDGYHVYGARVTSRGKVLDPNGILISRAFEHLCTVPRVLQLSLGTAKRRITKAHCSLGKVTRKHAAKRTRNRVLTQSPRPGRRLANGGRVNLTVGK